MRGILSTSLFKKVIWFRWLPQKNISLRSTISEKLKTSVLYLPRKFSKTNLASPARCVCQVDNRTIRLLMDTVAGWLCVQSLFTTDHFTLQSYCLSNREADWVESSVVYPGRSERDLMPAGRYLLQDVPIYIQELLWSYIESWTSNKDCLAINSGKTTFLF